MATTFWRIKGNNPKQYHWIEDDGTSAYIVHGDTASPIPMTFARKKSMGESLAFLLNNKKCEAVETIFEPGEYYPRIWRDNVSPSAQRVYEESWLSAMMGARNLFVRLKEVFRHVEPVKTNETAFGHEMRHLLVLACNEVEAQCKAVLRANGHKQRVDARTKRPIMWNIHDYAKLRVPMRLAEYEVRLTNHPGWGWVRPFESWSAGVEGLPWYNAYNAVKHDREMEFKEANLRNVVSALGAAYVLVVAQFGQFGRQGFSYSEIDEFYSKRPEFGPTEHYLPPHVQAGVEWHPVNCPL